MSGKRNYQVYGLYCVCGCDSGESIRYVGQASMGAQDRFNKHRYSARNNATWPVSRWMRKHGVENIRYIVLESLESSDEMDAAESRWIKELGTLIDLGGYNIMPGGSGVRGYSHAPWAKTRQTHEVSQETRDKISASLSGRFSGEQASHCKTTRAQVDEVISRYWAGQTILQIQGAMGLALSTISGITSGQSWKYVPRPETPRVVISTGRFVPGTIPGNTKLTEDIVREIRRRYDQGEHPKDLGVEYGVTKENIRMIVYRKTWKHVE